MQVSVRAWIQSPVPQKVEMLGRQGQEEEKEETEYSIVGVLRETHFRITLILNLVVLGIEIRACLEPHT